MDPCPPRSSTPKSRANRASACFATGSPASNRERPMTSPALTLLPAVDVADGKAVRLPQGAAGTETSYGDPVDAADEWALHGAEWIHLADLDAAFGRGT